jgi:hypothetical protein
MHKFITLVISIKSYYKIIYFFFLYILMPDSNEILIFMDTEKIGKDRCIPLTEQDYDKIKNYGPIRILITRTNTIQP